MGESTASPIRPRPEWNRALLVAWFAGALVPQVPFQFYGRMGNGHFGYNILITLGLALAGIVLVVGLLHLVRHVARTPAWQSRLPPLSSLLLGLCGLCSLVPFLPGIPRAVYLMGLASLGLWIIVVVAALVSTCRHPAAIVHREIALLNRRPTPWRVNGAFWLLVFALLFAIDLWSLGDIQRRSTLETILLVAGRFLTLAAFTLGAMLFTQMLLALFPRTLRWLAITVAALLPVVVGADFAAATYWQQSLLEVLNSFTLAGRFDLTQLLEAAGIRNSPFEVLLVLLAVTAVSVLLYLALHPLSRRLPARLHPSLAVGAFLALWLGAVGQQALSMATMRKEVWQAEHNTFKIHLGLFQPNVGLETIPVQVVERQGEEASETLLQGRLPALDRRPDIYLVMVETWRADSVTPEITPFLDRFRREECQPFDITLAGSNCTPVSWFTLFHSRPGIHWKKAVAKKSAPDGMPGAYPLRLLHQLGYSFSVRAVGDLGYQEMADVNYGSGHRLAATFLDKPIIDPPDLDIPEREVLVVDDLKKQLLATPVGGHLHFLSLDSPHYNYYWPHENFTPIHADCAGNISYASLNPSPEQIREVVKRYENAVHWIDRQIEDLVAFLKEHGRYDNSIIVLTGDHGEEFQEHGSWFHCSNLKRPQIEVPIMIKWPAWVRSQPPQGLVSHLDVMPSILDALGLDEKYYRDLAGQSLLREHSGEVLLSTFWAGTSNVGLCFVKDGLKANFAAALWKGAAPNTLYFVGYTDLHDQPLDPLGLRRNRSHSATLRQEFPSLTTRHFARFGEDPQQSR